jgi:hypothetical protein
MRSTNILLRGLGQVSLAVFALNGLASCTDDDPGRRDDGALNESSSALVRIEQARAEFLVRDVLSRPSRDGVVTRSTHAALGPAVATGFTPAIGVRASTHIQAKLDAAKSTARVEIPRRANDVTIVEDARSHVQVAFGLRGATDTVATLGGGYVLYPGAYEGADIIHRVTGDGTEDFVRFERRPARESLAYDLDISRAAGLRLVSNTLEVLDHEGTPVLRVAAPYVVDAAGSHPATLVIEGCAYDASPAGPWGREVTPPGASHCTVQVAWHDVVYPALVDPSWGTTGAMQVWRVENAATMLTNGKVLVTGGLNGINGGYAVAVSELYDPVTNTFAATGTMNFERRRAFAHRLPSGKVFISGGAFQDNGWGYVFTNSSQIYDPTTGTYSAGPNAPEAPHSSVALSSGDVLIVGGDWGGASGVYRHATNTITPTPSTLALHNYPMLTTLPSGKVLVAGGGDFEMSWYPEPTTVAEIFDPAANGGVGAFTATGSLPAIRPAGTSKLLPSGKVLHLGYSTTTDIFDPAANGGIGAFTAGPSTARSYAFPSVTTLGSQFLVVGTWPYVPSQRTEIFDSVLGTVGNGDSTITLPAFNKGTTLPSGKILYTGGGPSVLYDTSNRCRFPAMPLTFTATGQAGAVQLNWASGSALAPPSGYRITRYGPWGDPVVVHSVSGATTSFTDSGLPSNRSYTYLLKAWQDCNKNSTFDQNIDNQTSSNNDAAATTL